jgi:hypothetical protein
MSSSQITSCNSLNQPLRGSPSTSTAPNQDNTARQIQQTLRAGVLDALGITGSGHGVRGIAAALRQVLANADPDAPDPVPSLLETINTALDTAAKKLADQGVDQKTIDAAVKRFRSDLAHALDSLTPAAPEAAAGTASAAAVHAVTKEKFTLNILTAEGDRVSIRFRASNVTDVAAAQSSDDSGATAAVDAHVITRGRLKIEVQGDLNDDELKAIGDLLDQVDGIATDFFGGDVQAAFSAASRVGFDSQELSGFNLKLSYSQRIGFASTYAKTSTPVSAPAVPAPSAPVQTTAKPVIPEAGTRAAGAASSTPVSASLPAEDVPVDTPVPADSAPPVTTNAQQTIAGFAKDVLAKLAAVDGGGQVRFTLRWKVDFLMTALAAARPADAPEAYATQALGVVLNDGVGAAS